MVWTTASENILSFATFCLHIIWAFCCLIAVKSAIGKGDPGTRNSGIEGRLMANDLCCT